MTSQASSGFMHRLQEAAGLGAGGTVLGQVAPGLAHHPQRRARRRLAQQGAQQQVVLQRDGHDAAALAENPGNRLLDRLCRRARIGCIADRPADHDVVRAVRERLRDVDGALLVVDRLVLDRTDARRHHQQPVVDELAQHRRLEARRHHAVAAGLERAPRARQHQLLDVAGETEVVEVAAVEAGEHGHRQHLDVALGGGRRLHDPLVAVHGGERHAAIAQLPHRGRHGRRHVEELEVDEHLLAAPDHPVEQLEVAAGHEQLEAELVELTESPSVSARRRAASGSATSMAKIRRSRAGWAWAVAGIGGSSAGRAAGMIPEGGEGVMIRG